MGDDALMQPRTTSRLAWVAFGFVALLYLASLALSVLNRGENHPELSAIDPIVLAFLLFPAVGVLVATRQPRNPIGWILLGISLSWGLYAFMSGYSLHALVVDRGSLPRPDLILALNSWTWVPAVGLMGTFLILLFPNGRLPSSRWRPLAWLSAGSLAVTSAAEVITPGTFTDEGFPNITNPLGIEEIRPILEAIGVLGVIGILLSIAGCAASAIQRFRRAHGQERLQLKWLAAGAATTAFAYIALMASAGFLHLSDMQTIPVWAEVIELLGICSFLLIPLAIGVAILRHRLYDIDLIINRALVYGALTAALVIVYVGGVVVAGAVVRAVSRQESNDLAVAASTLVVAGLFVPLRRNVQSFIDRRFYRHKYDAQQTLADFSARLRDQIDLDALNAELIAVVQRTMQPAQASLWFTPQDRGVERRGLGI